MGQRRQVIEGPFGNAGDVIAMEGSEREAQSRGSTLRNSSEISGVPGWPVSLHSGSCCQLEGAPPSCQMQGCFRAQISSRDVGGRWFGKDKDGPLVFCLFVCFSGLPLWHMEIPRPGLKSELQPQANAIATAMWDLSHIWYPHHSSQPHQILNPLSEARDGTRIRMDAS